MPLVARRPRENRHVGDGVFLAGDEGLGGKLPIEHAIEALGLIDIALDAILDLGRCRTQEMMRLPQHRPEAAHLPHQPLHRVVARHTRGRQELRRLVGEVDQNGPGLEEAVRLAARTVGIEDRGNAVVGADAQELRLVLFALRDVDLVDAVRQPAFLEHDGNLAAVRRAPRMQFDHLSLLPLVSRNGSGPAVVVPSAVVVRCCIIVVT